MTPTIINTEPSVLSDLLARVEGAKGPNFALEEDIDRVVGHSGLVIPPAYTASVDAALALVERVLPGWEFALQVERPADGPAIWRVEMGDPLRHWTSEAATPALALLASMLRAIEGGRSS
jgi:hypothetical protein